jgi:cytochrome c551/c552
MNCFSNQRFSAPLKASFNARLLCLLTLMLGFSLSASLPAQEAEDPYRGTWQIDTPDDGALILIVKRNGLASYFWGDNADRTVYQGSWTSDADGATLTWQDGSTHQITHDTLGYAIRHNNANGQEQYTTIAQQVPKNVLGQWAKAPSKPEDATSDRDQAKGFFGTWEVNNGTDTYYVIIEPNRSAASNWSPGNASPIGLRGTWAKQGSELHIVWDTGHYSILKENERHHSLKLIPPGTVIGADESTPIEASRTSNDNLPEQWSTRYEAEKEADTGGIAFSSRKNAYAFYRGTWIVQRSAETFERIDISRFGGLSTSADRTLEGTWRMTGQDIFMRWDDGMRKVLSPVGQGFLLYEYKPGRPLDGVPTRIFSATPEDAAKLAAHMKGRQDVAEQMHSLAEAAGVTTAPEATGWGQTFMRWAWPFSENDQPQSTDALLQDEFEGTSTLDPWWWPFWSEKPMSADDAADDNSDTPADAPEASAESDTDTTDAASDATASAAPEKAKKTKPNWKWPF